MKRTIAAAVETSTTWEDSGFDCDHCGGRVLKRIDRETGLRDRVCFQCEQCSCQWTLERRPLRVGTTPACRAAQRDRAGQAEAGPGTLVRWPVIVLGVLLLLVMLRLGGGAVLRGILPFVVLAVVASVALFYGRRQGWW